MFNFCVINYWKPIKGLFEIEEGRPKSFVILFFKLTQITVLNGTKIYVDSYL